MAKEWNGPSPTALRPRPVQQRAVGTIDAVLTATIGLLEESGEAGVTVQQVLSRSGVSSGSLYHHFGDRDGLIAAAQVARFLRVVEIDDVLYRAAAAIEAEDTSTRLVTQFEQLIRHAISPERQEMRWVRISALASAHQRPALHDTLSAAMSRLFDTLEGIFTHEQRIGTLAADISPRTLAIYATVYGHGLVLDDLDPDAADQDGWLDVQRATFHAIRDDGSPRPTPSAPSGLPDHVRRRLERARDRLRRLEESETYLALLEDGLAPQGGRRGPRPASLDDASREVLAVASAAILAGRGRELTVEEVMAATGLSTGGFTRRFGNRAGMMDAVRLDIELRREHELLVDFARLVETAGDARAFRAGILGWVSGLSDSEPQHRTHVALDLLVSSRTDPILRTAFAGLTQRSTDLLVELIVHAQQRGLIRDDLSPQGIARMLQGHPIWFAMIGLDRAAPDPATWMPLLDRLLRGLDPSGQP
jgi:AcrR family transcriptional regulator